MSKDKWIEYKKYILLNEIIKLIHNSSEDTQFNSELMHLTENYYMNRQELSLKQLIYIKHNLIIK